MAYKAPVDEKQLIADLQNPSTAAQAFDTLMRAYGEQVYWQIRKMVVSHGDDSFLLQNIESDEYFDGDELQLELQRAIMQLPEKQRIVFNMRYFDEMKYEDMSEALGTSVGALKASYHHAVKKITAAIQNSRLLS